MKKQKPLYDLSLINKDLRVRSMSMMAQLLFIKLIALANNAGGMIAINGKFLSPEQAAMICGFTAASAAEFSEFWDEIVEMDLVEKRGETWCFPEMVAAMDLRIKRQNAGSKGGKKSAGCGAKHSREFCSSKTSSNIIPISKSKACEQSREYKAKKEKRTKKEKNNKNKYIYIFQEKVFTADQGELTNPEWSTNRNFLIYKREYEALLNTFPAISEEHLDDLLALHDNWLDKPENAGAPWLPCLLGYLRKVNDGLASKLDDCA